MSIPVITKEVVWLPEEGGSPLGLVNNDMYAAFEAETKEKMNARWFKEGAIDTAKTIPLAAISLVSGLFTAVSVWAGGPFAGPIGIPAATTCAASSIKIYTIWEKHNVAYEHIPKEIEALRKEYKFHREYKNISFEDAEKVAEWIFETAWEIHERHKTAFQWAFDYAKDHYMNRIQVHKEVLSLRKKYNITYDQAQAAHRSIIDLIKRYLYDHRSATREQAIEFAETHYFNHVREQQLAIIKAQHRIDHPEATEQEAAAYAAGR